MQLVAGGRANGCGSRKVGSNKPRTISTSLMPSRMLAFRKACNMVRMVIGTRSQSRNMSTRPLIDASCRIVAVPDDGGGATFLSSLPFPAHPVSVRQNGSQQHPGSAYGIRPTLPEHAAASGLLFHTMEMGSFTNSWTEAPVRLMPTRARVCFMGHDLCSVAVPCEGTVLDVGCSRDASVDVWRPQFYSLDIRWRRDGTEDRHPDRVCCICQNLHFVNMHHYQGLRPRSGMDDISPNDPSRKRCRLSELSLRDRASWEFLGVARGSFGC